MYSLLWCHHGSTNWQKQAAQVCHLYCTCMYFEVTGGLSTMYMKLPLLIVFCTCMYMYMYVFTWFKSLGTGSVLCTFLSVHTMYIVLTR